MQLFSYDAGPLDRNVVISLWPLVKVLSSRPTNCMLPSYPVNYCILLKFVLNFTFGEAGNTSVHIYNVKYVGLHCFH